MCQRPSQNSQASFDEVQRLGKMHFNPVHDPWHVVVHLVAVLEHHSVFAHEPTAASLSSQQPVKFAENRIIEKIVTVRNQNFVIVVTYNLHPHCKRLQFSNGPIFCKNIELFES